MSCFDIGEVPRNRGKWNCNWLSFLPFIFSFEQCGYLLYVGFYLLKSAYILCFFLVPSHWLQHCFEHYIKNSQFQATWHHRGFVYLDQMQPHTFWIHFHKFDTRYASPVYIRDRGLQVSAHYRTIYLVCTYLKVSKFQKQIFLSSFEPKKTNEIIFWFLL